VDEIEHTPTTASHDATAPFPIVGLGASAGGLEALRQLFAHLPADSGMAYVVIQHLDPDRPSMLTQVLRGVTRLPVVEVESGMRPAPDRVHVIPAGADLGVHDGVLTLVPRQRTGQLHLPIDAFFRALAGELHSRAIGVVLSGSGADGTEGLRAIKAEGGIALAQAPETAEFTSMPESAIGAGVVDFRGPPAAIAAELARLSRHAYLADAGRAEGGAAEPAPDEESELAALLALVRQHAGVDFSGYKQTTVLRRIERRMALRRVARLGEYARVLHDDPGEVRALAQDMLIHVTSFFRDPAAFEALTQHVLRPLAERKRDGAAIRIWVPGCATGEEAYAIAICLLEALADQADRFAIKLFGSDLSDAAIATARLGRYPEAALAAVSPERLARFFERAEGGYRVGQRVRDLCVFVKHDLTRDPPFARLDLISCRNVLIYFDAELQRRVIPLLHYCLDTPGYLFLGRSEALTGFSDLFAPVDKGQRIFVKTGESTRFVYPLAAGREVEVNLSPAVPVDRRQPAREAQRQADHLLLTRFAPPGVVVNERLEVIQYRGRTGAYLESPPGQPEAHVLRLAREGLAAHLHEALERARAESVTVRRDGVRVQTAAGQRSVDLEVVPLAGVAGATERFFLILFEEPEPRPAVVAAPAAAPAPPPEEGEEARRHKAELVATKDYLQALIGEHQSATDELAATNEELIAANEELQSANEELQSAKEELQSTNEELGTVNDELRSRNAELDRLANDLVNVLASVEIPVIIVDLELRVRRFTPTVREIASFIPGDVGRPIGDLKLKVKVDDLADRVREVVTTVTPKEWEIQGPEDRWFRLQIRPYRTADNRLDGAVLSFVDIDLLKHALNDAEGARDYARSIVETVTTALVVLDSDLRVVTANHAFDETLALAPEAPAGVSLFAVGAGVLDQPAARSALTEAVTGPARLAALELTVELPRAGRKVLALTGRPILWSGGAPMFLLAIDDVTALRALEAERVQLLASETQARLEAERANRAKDLFLATLSHELRTPLSTMVIQSQILRRLAVEDPRLARASAAIERSATTQAKLIEDLLDVSRIVSGKLLLDLGAVDLKETVQSAADVARPAAEAKSITFEVALDDAVETVYGDATRLHQVVGNLLTNAIKFTPHGGRVALRLERQGERAQITVADSGMGIRPEVLPQIFSQFVQADSSVTRTHGGLGLGLSIVRHLVEVHGGEVQAESPGEGQGATFRVTLPLGAAARTRVRGAPRLVARDITGVRVLVVEDEDDARESFVLMLEQLGARVTAAPSAAAGLAAFAASPPQVILCDIAMPGEDGYGFIRKVRRRAPEQGGAVPAAALTALASDEDRRRALQAGFQLHLAKPVDAARLAAAVGALAAWTEPVGAPPGGELP
jgi:two-component system CheB/CheR fusion protein